MKKIYNQPKQHRSFRRLVGQFFVSLIKRQNCKHQDEFKTIIQMLREIEDSIEIIARQVARWVESGK